MTTLEIAKYKAALTHYHKLSRELHDMLGVTTSDNPCTCDYCGIPGSVWILRNTIPVTKAKLCSKCLDSITRTIVI